VAADNASPRRARVVMWVAAATSAAAGATPIATPPTSSVSRRCHTTTTVRQPRASTVQPAVPCGVAQLTGAATVPAHRRHGVQTALLAARLADAARTGCDIAVVTTQPGSKSQQNVQRQGFDLLYTRAVLVMHA
jgi:hypothetical protein